MLNAWSAESLSLLAEHSSEFLVHAADVEGKQQGIDAELVANLGKWISGKVGCCYAGGGKCGWHGVGFLCARLTTPI